MIFATIAAAAMSAAAPEGNLTHHVSHDNQGRTVTAAYAGAVDIGLRQRGMAAAPGRMGTQRCDWSATVSVTRSLPEGQATPLGSKTVLTGMRAGDCLTVASGIERDVARRSSALKDHVVTVAEADRPNLTASLAPRTSVASSN